MKIKKEPQEMYTQNTSGDFSSLFSVSDKGVSFSALDMKDGSFFSLTIGEDGLDIKGDREALVKLILDRLNTLAEELDDEELFGRGRGSR